MFFISISLMITAFITGGVLLGKGMNLYGGISLAIGGVLFLFILFYYGLSKKKRKKFDCTPDFDCDFFDCDGPDCG